MSLPPQSENDGECEFTYSPAVILEPENDEGKCEYKFKLTDLSKETLAHRITQLHFRLNEGSNIYSR